MYDRSPTVESLMNEHSAIRGHMELVQELIREWDSLFESNGDILKSPDKLRMLTAKRRSLVQAMGYLEEGLRSHHLHEDNVMPPLVGDLLWQAIRLEHGEMLERLDKIDSLLLNAGVESFVEKGEELMQSIGNMVRMISSHSVREDGMLYFLKKLPDVKG